MKEFKKKGFRTLNDIEEELEGKKRKEEKLRKKDNEVLGMDKVMLVLFRAKQGG